MARSDAIPFLPSQGEDLPRAHVLDRILGGLPPGGHPGSRCWRVTTRSGLGPIGAMDTVGGLSTTTWEGRLEVSGSHLIVLDHEGRALEVMDLDAIVALQEVACQ